MAHGLETIDWHAPWLAPYKDLAEHAATHASELTQVSDLLNGLRHGQNAAPVEFVPQSCLPAGVAYEQYIFDTQQCPTRDGLHDFFNGLCWHRFPQTKHRLNQLQAAQIEQLGSVTTRGAVRDALTVFDENAAFLFAPPELWQALINKDWQRLFVTLRHLWPEAQLFLFGHALLEKLVNPRKAITAHVYICHKKEADTSFDATNLAAIDDLIAAELDVKRLANKPFAPLPVLGVPGWWVLNESEDFYKDKTVFRTPHV